MRERNEAREGEGENKRARGGRETVDTRGAVQEPVRASATGESGKDSEESESATREEKGE